MSDTSCIRVRVAKVGIARLFILLEIELEDRRVSLAQQQGDAQSLSGRIRGMVEPSVNALGYAVVQLRLMEGKYRKRLEIMAERTDGTAMGFDDCTAITRAVSALLDVDDPISGAYDLEVLSPGIDRPLTCPADFERYKGYEIKVETVLAVDSGRKRLKGKAEPKGKSGIVITTTEGLVEVAYTNIRSAKLVITDELINEHLRQAEGKAPLAKPQKPRKQPKRKQ